MSSMTEVKCKCCGDKFQARTADVKRGWGKFCSKSCKAKKQERKTGQMAAYLNRQRQYSKTYDDDFDGSWDAHNCYTEKEPPNYDTIDDI